jgi:hypothetical protein
LLDVIGRDFTMAEPTKLSVGQALDKMRGSEPPASRMTQLDAKIDTLDDEILRLRTARRRVEWDQRAASIKPDTRQANPPRFTRIKIFAIAGGVLTAILILGWIWAAL